MFLFVFLAQGRQETSSKCVRLCDACLQVSVLFLMMLKSAQRALRCPSQDKNLPSQRLKNFRRDS